MTLEQLRIFVAVAEREHVTRAAEFLNLTQSAVSHAVTQLEGEFQLSFFSRVGRRIELTEAGRRFLDEARTVLNRAEVARERMLDLSGLRDGVLRIHASHTIASYWLPARLNAFRAAHPGIRLHVAIANTRDIGRLVQSGEASIGLVEGELPTLDLCSDIVAHDRLLLVVAPDHPWATTPPDVGSLLDTPWVLREAGSGTRMEFEQGLRVLGVDPDKLDIVLEVASNEAVAGMVETGDAAAVLSASVVAGRVEAGLLCVAPLPLPDRQFRVLRHPQQRLSPAEHAFLTLLGLTITPNKPM
ncbi:LysR family transcriptional regulator [Acetobacter nitrogenifigens DSM 23921 = NBRC 105050]|uniref:LysR family transcriptional regulator n=1 Tax=Acetobacter nitrogenifigens DSM 23921 = NBRC 105050 TaxID=1120919 RepID=A0A511XBJ8_9PROT|nr:LysR family transcriptional regulator [Acetobacter nitrogenifigens]GBQ90790.1 LysR family transcriptional regulator [Acetobacter nitrogenifigens DSM 23921 = NBRC 105050]GEN60251.1 LysR family transcriptional regulator [Acetobacter nitrogenifigens DSM 23921 = NBRC 105050]